MLRYPKKNMQMLKVKPTLSLLLILLICFNGYTQINIPIGTWRSHSPGRICTTIDKVGNKLFAASNSCFIVYNKEDNTVKNLSKIDGLNDAGVSKIKYHEATGTLVIGYANGNIDLMTEDGVTNLNDIKRSNIMGSKNINHIAFKGNLAYLSCAFGIVVVDLVKVEIKETYLNIGPNGTQIEVSSVTFKGDSIFIASAGGIMAGSTLPNYNLIDFNNWLTFKTANGIPANTVFKSIGTLNNRVYASTAVGAIYTTDGTQWVIDNSFIFPTATTINISFSNNTLQFIHRNKIISLNSNAEKTEINNLNSVYDAYFESATTQWLADSQGGIIKNEGENKTKIYPNSPYYNTAFRLRNFTDWNGIENIVVTTGGYDDGGTAKKIPNGIYIFRDGIWENFNSELGNFPSGNDFECYIESDYNTADSSLYVASWKGLVKFKRTGVNTANSVLLNRFNTNNNMVDLYPDGGYYVLFDVKFDSNHKGWIIGSQRSSIQQPTLFSFKGDQWKAYNFADISEKATLYPVEIMIDGSDNKWIRYPKNNGGGIVVFNENLPVGKQYKYLTDQVGQGKLPSMGTSCLSKDINGAIWVGTDKGIAVFNNPTQILNSTSYEATTPVFENQPLLHDKAVKCITIDGANRKWIGTDAGVWLFNEDGSKEIANFNIDNSPLPSNNIYDIEICKTTGEVFFATDAGIISYRGDATDPLTINTNEASEFKVKIFPNPITPEFSGYIGISGLPSQTNVKITDINGVLVYETQSNGGTATWNGHTYNGEKVQSGVYLVFATNKEGLQTMVSKFAVIK